MKGLAERLYAARLERERCATDFLPLYDHLLNLAINDAAHDNPQGCGRMLAKARKLTTYDNPTIERDEWWYGNRKGYRVAPFRYLLGPPCTVHTDCAEHPELGRACAARQAA